MLPADEREVRQVATLVEERLLLDRHHLAQPSVIRPDAGADVLRISNLRCSGETDQIAEQHRHDLPLLLSRRDRLLDERRRAEAAEGEPLRILLTATRADRH